MYQKFLELKPEYTGAYIHAAEVAVRAGESAIAISLLRQGHDRMSDNIVIANDLAWRLATVPDERARNGEEAVRLAEYVNAHKGSESCNELDTLAAAYAEAGMFEKAVSTAERALMIAQQTAQPDLAEMIAGRLALFREGKPYHGL